MFLTRERRNGIRDQDKGLEQGLANYTSWAESSSPSAFVNRFTGTQLYPYIYVLPMAIFWFNGRIEQLQQSTHGSQCLKCLLSGPLGKMFSDHQCMGQVEGLSLARTVENSQTARVENRVYYADGITLCVCWQISVKALFQLHLLS